jgi:hypothetical protein
MKQRFCFLLASALILFSCTTTKAPFNPEAKYPGPILRDEYTIFRNVLEESHPSLYWYISKDSMDYYFDKGYSQIKDSMSGPAFKTLLAYVVAKINCGHTGVKFSKDYSHYLDTATLQSFPLSLKIWADTMVITANLNRKDSILKRGVVVKSINGHPQEELRDSLFKYVITDGYSLNGKYQSLSTGFAFANWYKNVYGLLDSFSIYYLDTLGLTRNRQIPVYDFKSDTMGRLGFRPARTPGEKKKAPPQLTFFSSTSLRLDTSQATAYMSLQTFDRGNHLKKFFKRSFKALDENKIKFLVIDVRSNGGGDAGLSSLLTRYLIDKKFKLADSLYAVTRSSQYDQYISKSWMYHLLMQVITKKRDDGKYHFGYFERHYFKPKKSHHFNGDVYILIGGNSFSATTLFAGFLKGQKNVTLVGEETGGGFYGNTAWVIEEVTLPNTKTRFTLPKFRLVIDKNREKNGRGVMPDVWSLPTTDAIRMGVDFKSIKTHELIQSRAKEIK